MTSIVGDLWEQALALSAEDRRQLAHALLETVEEQEPGYDEAWRAEIQRRLEDGDDAWIPVEEARRQILGRRAE